MKIENKPQTLLKALKIIEAIAASQPVEVRHLSRLVGIPLPTTYRFVATLEENGYVRRGPEDGKCQLGLSFVRFGAISLRSFHLGELVRPILREIGTQTGESVSFQVRKGAEAICLDCVESEHSIRLSQRIGQVTPLYAGSGPKVLLAYTSDIEGEKIIKSMRLVKIGPKTLSSKAELKRRLIQIVRRGYDFSEEEVTEGARGVAVPVFGSSGNVVAALSVSGLKYRMGKAQLISAIKILKGSAERLSSQLPLALVSVAQ